MVGFQAMWASLKELWLFKLTGRHKDREVFTSQMILTVGRCFLSTGQCLPGPSESRYCGEREGHSADPLPGRKDFGLKGRDRSFA